MKPFATGKENASVDAQAIAYIHENNLLNTNASANNTKIDETRNDLRLHRDITSRTFKDRLQKFEDKKKYYIVGNREIRKWEKFHHVFSVKEKLLELKKSSKVVSPEIQKLFPLLSESETSFGGKVVPMYNLWTRLLWFMPKNEVMYLFEKYEKRMAELTKLKKSSNKKEGCHGSCVFEHKFNAKLSISSSANIAGELNDVINVTIFNDVQYLCDHILSKIEKQIMEYFPKIVVEEEKEEIVIQKPKPKVLTQAEEEAAFEEKQTKIAATPVVFDDEDW